MATDDIRMRAEELVIGLAKVRQLSQMYGRDHKIAREGITAAFSALEGVLSAKSELTIGIIGDEIAYEKEPFYETSLRISEFIQHLKDIGIKKMSFSQGVNRKEFEELARVLAMKADAVTKDGGVQKIFAAAGVAHIITGELGLAEGKGASAEQAMIDELTRKNYDGGVEYLAEAYQEVKGNKKLNVNSARQIVSGMVSDILKNKNLLLVLTSVRGSSESLFAHGMNVAVFTLMQAEALGIGKEQMMDVGVAALLHDVGRLASAGQEEEEEDEDDMSDEAIKKRTMQDVKGAKMLLETDGISPLAAIVAFEHNIKYDKTGGGPRKLYGEDLNLASMIIAIASYYDRLRMKPSYKLEGGPEKAYEEMMKLAGKDFHPDLLNNFFSMVGVYPPGTLVELDTGEVALVIQSSLLDKKRPQVEIIYDPNGAKYAEPKLVNILEKDEKGRFKWTIVKSLSPMDKYEIPEKYSS